MTGPGGGGGFEAVLDHLTTEILEGRVVPGERIPSERDLAAQLGASRSAVREAIKVLQAQGVLRSSTSPSAGTRVATGQGVALGRMLKLHVALDAVSFGELTEIRVVLERAAGVTAAEQAETADVERLAGILDEMEQTPEQRSYNELDTSFHVAIAAIGANRLARDLTIAIREAVASQILQAETAMPDWPGLREQLNEQHRGILEALASGDGNLTADRCEDHIRRAHRALLRVR